MHVDVFDTHFEGRPLKVEYETNKGTYLCVLGDEEEHYTITQDHDGHWFELKEGATTLAERIGILIEERSPAKSLGHVL